MLHKSKKNRSRFAFRLLVVTLLLNIISFSVIAQQGSNDYIFPASAKAKPFIDFDSKGFLINGKRTFIVSAGIEYARVPHELWEDRLLRLKRCGFNCVEIYTFWNFHEPHEGKFDFSGDHDLEAFLKLVHKMGMYVIARVGPYYCAEWDNGGYPLWLKFKPGLRVREHNAEFEKYTGRFFDKLLPIVFRNQINHGGAVIMVQLENEHNESWGTYIPNGYFSFLRDKALSLGMEVPYFFSGLHHASSPAEDGKCDDPQRPNPWLTTEFWSVWFSGYSSTDKDAREYERRTWKIIANGGNGYNYYMAHGGSNFGYTNNDEDAASYDYGAAVGQGGDLRPIYYSFKKTAFFARSFQDILENSTNADEEYKNISNEANVHVTARKSAAGDILFLENKSSSPSITEIYIRNEDSEKKEHKIDLDSGEIFPVVHNFKLTPGITLRWSFAKILTISKQKNTTTIIIYGKPSVVADMIFDIAGKTAINKGKEFLSVQQNSISLSAKFDDSDKPTEYSFKAGDQVLRILAVSESLAGRTWMIDNNREPYIVFGPSYISNANFSGNNISLTTERPWLQNKEHDVWLYDAIGAKKIAAPASANLEKIKTLFLSPWKVKSGSGESKTEYNDHDWKQSEDPLQMGADGDLTADAWYRTTINIDSPGMHSLLVEGGDRAIIFIDQKLVATAMIKNGEISFYADKGKHTLAIFTAHDGRDKLAGFTGAIDSADVKGIFGKTFLTTGNRSTYDIVNWKFLRASATTDVVNEPLLQNNFSWNKYTIGDDVFDKKQGFGWFRATLSDLPANISKLQLKFRSVDENATVFVNNIKLTKHDGWNKPFSITVDHIDTMSKPIVLTLFIENYSNEGGIDRAIHAIDLSSATQLTGWRMRGGIGEINEFDKWQNLDADFKTEGPAFFAASFEMPATTTKSHPVYRVTTQGLGHGSVWVNGHNLGRYPEKIPLNGLYIPECWLQKGKNNVVIFDEDGKKPTSVGIEAEEAASRDIKIYTSVIR
jgi:beta-galactosidase